MKTINAKVNYQNSGEGEGERGSIADVLEEYWYYYC